MSRLFGIVATFTLLSAHAVGNECCAPCAQDRVHLISTRHLVSDACRAPLDCPSLRIWRCASDGFHAVNLDEYSQSLSPDRPVIVYVHGNRMPSCDLMTRFNAIRRRVRAQLCGGPIDWVVFSWPSDRAIKGIEDFRVKANRCDAQGLYLAWLLREHVRSSVRLGLIGYSFGARVATGSLHAMAGGRLAGRSLPGEAIVGSNIRVGLIAPAIESEWLSSRGYHCRATKNLKELVLLYNRRDAVLKRYWIIEKVRSETALGFTGPTHFAARADGTCLPVRSRDYSPSVRFRHSELDYYSGKTSAACDIARMINAIRRSDRR